MESGWKRCTWISGYPDGLRCTQDAGHIDGHVFEEADEMGRLPEHPQYREKTMSAIKLDTLCECGRPFSDHGHIGTCPEVGCSHFKAVEMEKTKTLPKLILPLTICRCGQTIDNHVWGEPDRVWICPSVGCRGFMEVEREKPPMLPGSTLFNHFSSAELEAELERRKKKAVEEEILKSHTGPWKNLDLNGFSTAALEREIIARGDATEKCHSPFPWSPASHHGVNDAEGKSVCICSGSLDAELNERNTANARILSCAENGVELAYLVESKQQWKVVQQSARDLLKKAGL